MPVFRAIVFLALVASVLCFAMYVATGQVRYRAIGIRVAKWTIFVALGFFAVLILERLAIIL